MTQLATTFLYPAIRTAIVTNVHEALRTDSDLAQGQWGADAEFGLNLLPAAPHFALRWKDFDAALIRRHRVTSYGDFEPELGKPQTRMRSAKLLPVLQPMQYSICVPTIKTATGDIDHAGTDEMVDRLEKRMAQLVFQFGLKELADGVSTNINPLATGHAFDQDAMRSGADDPDGYRIQIRVEWVLRYEAQGC